MNYIYKFISIMNNHRIYRHYNKYTLIFIKYTLETVIYIWWFVIKSKYVRHILYLLIGNILSNFVDPTTGATTNHIERSWRGLKE